MKIICGKTQKNYLWPASLPREPMVRSGVEEGCTQVGSGVLRTSVFTSGSISEGDGVSFAPAMAPSPPPPSAKPPSGSDRDRFSLCSARQSSRRDARKAHLPSHCCCCAKGGAAAACGSLRHHGLLRHTEASSSWSPAQPALLHPCWWRRQVLPLRRRLPRVVTM